MRHTDDDLVEDYEQLSASQNIGGGQFHNFYDDEIDDEYSEAFGDFMKNIGSKFKGLSEKIRERGGGKDARRSKRKGNRAMRKGRREARRNERQARKMAQNTPEVKQETKTISQASPVVSTAVVKTASGVATPQQDIVATKTVEVAKKIQGQLPGVVLDAQAVKDEIAKIKTEKDASVVLDELLDDSNPKGQKGWAGISTLGKVGIIGGGLAVVGLTLFLVLRKKNK
jgi:hypothetical protein